MERFGGGLFDKGKKTWEQLNNLRENEGILDKKIEELSCRNSDVLAELERAKLQFGKVPKKEVELWLKNVANIRDEVCDIKQKLREADQNPLPPIYALDQRWTHYHSRINLAELVEKKIKEIVELKENGRFQEGLLIDLLPGTLEAFPTTELVGDTTALKNFKEIKECLLDDKIRKIGIYGMGGVGKTIIMTHIHNNFKNAQTFDSVIWVTVSRNSSLEKLQEDVSKALHISPFNNEDALRRSAELLTAFKRRGKFLLILDDMWRTFPSTKVGIPEPNEVNKCKIVWTTRYQSVCRGMGSQRTIKVDCLTEDESWALFKGKLGGDFMISPEIEPIAKAVVKECDGLPLAIITVGAALRGVDDIRIWRNALEDLRNSRPELEGLDDDVFTCLKFSFDHLKTQRHRDCFLFCALFPEDAAIDCDELIEYWMADGFFDEIEDREKGFDKGYTIINDLKDACILENFCDERYVKMHDLLRDLAIAITRKSPRFFVKTGFGVRQFPRDENLMEDVVRISLIKSDIEMISCQPKCPKLRTLLLRNCRKLKSIDDLFFDHMPNLRVLDLSFSSIRCLPQSLSKLVQLRALLLGRCWYIMGEIPSLVKLTELRVLDLAYTVIQCLPEGIKGLTNLRRLDLSFTKKLEMIPDGTFPNFSCLEELFMRDSEWKWSSNTSGRVAGVEEISRLTRVRKVSLNFKDLTALSSYVRSRDWQDIKYFHLGVNSDKAAVKWGPSVGDVVKICGTGQCMRPLVIPESTRTLEFNDCDDVPLLSEIPCIWSFKQLESCNFFCCAKMEYIVNKAENPFLPSLSEQYISWMANLKTIDISYCPKLKYVFTVGWLQTLQCLEEIRVSNCKEVEAFVVEQEDMVKADNTNIAITLQRLKRLYLLQLPQLQSISTRTFVCKSLEVFEADCWPKLNKLPFSVNNIPSSDSSGWGDNLDIKSQLQPFFKRVPDVKYTKNRNCRRRRWCRHQ